MLIEVIEAEDQRRPEQQDEERAPHAGTIGREPPHQPQQQDAKTQAKGCPQERQQGREEKAQHQPHGEREELRRQGELHQPEAAA